MAVTKCLLQNLSSEKGEVMSFWSFLAGEWDERDCPGWSMVTLGIDNHWQGLGKLRVNGYASKLGDPRPRGKHCVDS